MEASELRIRNLLLLDKEIKKVSSIHNDNTIRFEDKEKGSIGCFKASFTNIEPIELTEELLFKCGFNDKGHEEINKYEENLNVFCIGEDDKFKIKFHREWYGSEKEKEGIDIYFYQSDDYITCIKYLHQLQNLYFSLTQTELQITL